MLTVTTGVMLPTMNRVLTEVFAPLSCWVVLSDTPNVVTRVTLPVTTHGVILWTTTDDQIWYALDTTPGPIPPPVGGTLISEFNFVVGGVILGNMLQLFELPDDSLQHELQLVSNGSSPRVLLTALTEIT
jgi:hypothetical protein